MTIQELSNIFHLHQGLVLHALSQKLAFAGAEHQKKLGEQAQDFHKTFREEVTALVAPITVF